MYDIYVTKIKNIRPHPNADRLNIGEAFGNGVVIDKSTTETDLYLYLPLSHLIEFHGKQHYQETNGTWTQANTLEERQLRDKLKEEYCKEHNIPLIIIPYDQIGKITIELLLKRGN